MATTTRKRCDSAGRAFAGSQLQIQIYVNRRQRELNEKILDTLMLHEPRATTLRWVSPLRGGGIRRIHG